MASEDFPGVEAYSLQLPHKIFHQGVLLLYFTTLICKDLYAFYFSQTWENSLGEFLNIPYTPLNYKLRIWVQINKIDQVLQNFKLERDVRDLR